LLNFVSLSVWVFADTTSSFRFVPGQSGSLLQLWTIGTCKICGRKLVKKQCY